MSMSRQCYTCKNIMFHTNAYNSKYRYEKVGLDENIHYALHILTEGYFTYCRDCLVNMNRLIMKDVKNRGEEMEPEYKQKLEEIWKEK